MGFINGNSSDKDESNNDQLALNAANTNCQEKGYWDSKQAPNQ